MSRLAGIELGGTKIIAAIAEGTTIVARERWETGQPADTLAAVNRWLRERQAEAQFEALGIAAFGPVRVDPAASDFGHILSTPKPGWAGADLAPLADGLGVPWGLDTDVNAAALAEARWGAGAGANYSSLVYLTIGTGIGAGVLIDGHPLHGALHPEIGHLRVRKADGFAGVCPSHGDCAEGLVAGPALWKRLGGDPNAAADLDAPARDLAELFAALLLAYAPNRLLVGGGIGVGVPRLIDAACAHVPAILNGYLPGLDSAAAVRAVIEAPRLGADAGPLGAIAVADEALRLR
ncbi:ROK family protein [Sphingomonas sp. ASV193]|uniref:ROK family protein n=1 Tax=Sphingomonas sp. ASV193 TaxID=3144405 RepID=UPI0032E91FDA